MLLRIRIGVLGVVACLALAACGGGGGGPTQSSTPSPTTTPSIGPSPSPTPTIAPTASPTPSAVTISDGGSTNRKPFTIVLQFDDSAVITQDGNTRNSTVTAAETMQFYSDILANVPVGNVNTLSGCTKSSSYGTTTTLTYSGSTSGDISCPPSTMSPAQTLYADVQNIESQVGPFNN